MPPVRPSRDKVEQEEARMQAAWRQLALELSTPEPPQPPLQHYQIALMLREMGAWDGVSRLVIYEPVTLWRALQAGELTVEDLEPESHYHVLQEAHR